MEPQPQKQQQQQSQYQYQYLTQNETTPQSYDPTQIQSYDHQHSYCYSSSSSTTSYYPHYTTQPQTQTDYSSAAYYYPPDYSTSYQTHDPNSIHPPGVPLSSDSQQTHLLNPHTTYYYPPPPSPQYLQPVNPAYGVGGSQESQSARGRGRGTFGQGRGRGRGKGVARGKHATFQTPGSSAPGASSGVKPAQSVASSSVRGQSTPGKPPPRMAWCELCRVDCTTPEILEQHKNGKKHQRNLKVFEELQNLSRHVTVQKTQKSKSDPKIDSVHLKVPDGSDRNQLSTENVASASVHMENKAEAVPGRDGADKAEPSVAPPFEQSLSKDHFGGRGGLKRKMRGGRGGKWIRAHDGSRRPVELPKPKQVPILCDLCNVKCESQIVFESHVAGKKHLSNMKRFQGHKEAFGENIQALYPTIPNLPSTSIIPKSRQQGPQDANPPSTSIIPQTNQQVPQDANIPATSIIPQTGQQGPQDAQALASMMLSKQNLRDPQAAQAALTQLLTQHGIHDTQTLITQLVPHMLAQFQVPGSVPVPEASVAGADVQNVAVEVDVRQENLNYAGSEADGGTSNNADTSPPETGNAELVFPAPQQ